MRLITTITSRTRGWGRQPDRDRRGESRPGFPIPALLVALTMGGCEADSGGQAVDDPNTAEEIAQEILDDHGTPSISGGLTLSGDAALAYSLAEAGLAWTAEDVARNRREAQRLRRESTLKWTREYLAALEGGAVSAERFTFGAATLAEEIVLAKNQIGYVANAIERQRLSKLPDAEQLEPGSCKAS